MTIDSFDWSISDVQQFFVKRDIHSNENTFPLIKASEKDNRKSIEMYERAIKKDLKH